jgi:hypothetical protein
MGNATTASLESTAGKKSSAGIQVLPAHSQTIQHTAASAKHVARRSNRAEIHITASLLEACSANRNAARGPRSDRGDSARPMSNTSTALTVWISRFVR